jgi:hypothetical protein
MFCFVCLTSNIIEMLTWKAGGRKEDGLWAYVWYKNTHASTGFARGDGDDGGLVKRAPRVDVDALPAEAQQVIAECMPYYNHLIRSGTK